MKYRLDGQTVNACSSCAEGLEFKSRTGQILHSVANGSPPLKLRRNTASIMKGLVLVLFGVFWNSCALFHGRYFPRQNEINLLFNSAFLTIREYLTLKLR